MLFLRHWNCVHEARGSMKPWNIVEQGQVKMNDNIFFPILFFIIVIIRWVLVKSENYISYIKHLFELFSVVFWYATRFGMWRWSFWVLLTKYNKKKIKSEWDVF